MIAILTRAFMAAFCTSALTEFTQIGALLIDGLITSRYMGAEKMAAVGIAAPFFFLVGIIGTSIAVGLQTVCTKEMGAGNTGRMNYIFNETLEAALAVALAFSFLVYLEAPPMAAMFGARGRAILLLDETIEYLHGLVGEVVPYVLLSVITPLVLLDNGNRIVMISSVTGAVSNIFLDILFVRLDFGIWGMGMATSLSVIFSLLVLLSHFLRKNRILHLKPVPINLTNIGRILILSGPRAIHDECHRARIL
jgi:Na+-driven multidrug efflux pump